MVNNNPSIDPANEGTLAGLLQLFRKKMMQGTDGVLPARVLAYKRETNRVKVQPVIAVVGTDGTVTQRAQVASIPVLQFGGGEFFLSFPLKEGDLGWIVANDRDISLFLQGYNDATPNTDRLKSFSDAVFIPDVMTGYTIAEEDEERAVLSNMSGTVRISIGTADIKITSPLTTIDGNLVVTGAIGAQAGINVTGGAFNVTGNMGLTGNIAVVGNITATGSITPGV